MGVASGVEGGGVKRGVVFKLEREGPPEMLPIPCRLCELIHFVRASVTAPGNTAL